VFISHSNEKKARRGDCVGSSGTELPSGRSGVKVQAGPGIFIFYKISRPALGLTQAVIPWATGDIFSGGKKSVDAFR
jgi:hypothetical protein